VTRLLTILSSPHLKISFPSSGELHDLQSSIQSTWCNWMDVLLLHLSSASVQSLIVSYLKFKDSKAPTYFQTLLLHRLLSYVTEGITAVKDFDWKTLIESKTDLSEEKLSEGIQWKGQGRVSSLCADMIVRIASASSSSLEIVIPILFNQISSKKSEETDDDELPRVGLTLLCRKILKSTKLTESNRLMLSDQTQLLLGSQQEMVLELLQEIS
jgi:hypothetical protein